MSAPWLEALHAVGRGRLDTLPRVGDEAWKYTSPRLAFGDAPAPAEGAFEAGSLPEGDHALFVDGRLASAVGVTALSSADGLDAPLGGFDALNLSTLQGGVTLFVEGRRTLKLVHRVTTPALASLRHRLVLAPNAELDVTMIVEGAADALVTQVTAVEVGAGAQLRWSEVQRSGGRVLHALGLTLARDASADATFCVIGPRLARTELHTRLADGASVNLRGLALGRAEQHVDLHTDTVHAGKHATSRQLFKAILDDRARSVYTGRVEVPVDAVGSDVGQASRTLLLSEGASARNRPQLEIRCDEVKASHGAAIGSLDPEAQFFLQSRGLDAREARALLTTAFAGEIVAAVADPALRAELEPAVANWLHGEVA